MKIKILVLFTCLALTGCKVENKEGDTVVTPEKETKETTIITPGKETKETTIIDKTKTD